MPWQSDNPNECRRDKNRIFVNQINTSTWKGILSFCRCGFRAAIPVVSAAICDLSDGNFASLPSAMSPLLTLGVYWRAVRPLPTGIRPPYRPLDGEIGCGDNA
jgi:hypothetical protein